MTHTPFVSNPCPATAIVFVSQNLFYGQLPHRGAFLLTKRRDSKGRPRRSLGKNCPVDIILCESPGLQMSLRASAHTGVALSKDSLWSQSVSKAFPSGVVLRAANQNLTIASGNCSIMYRWLARLPQARDG